MYRVVRSDGAVLYDVRDPDNYLLTEPIGTFEIGQPGSLQFSMVPSHPRYNEVFVMETYVSAIQEGEEIFYGRVIDINVDKTTGLKQIECAGALQFLDDGEIPPLKNEDQQEGTQDEGVEMYPADFFARCINAYNSEVGNDGRRRLYVGTVNHSKAYTKRFFQVQSYTKISQAIQNYITGEFGGFLRVRPAGDYHVVDWLENFGESNSSPVKLMHNVVSMENAISAGDLVTVLRPTGKDGITLPEGTVAISDDLVHTYGRIIMSVSFKDAETEADLRGETADYISRMGKGLGKVCTVKMVDMHFLDGETPRMRMGAVYTNLSGFEDVGMIVAGLELHFANPAEDTVTFKNEKELKSAQRGGSTSKGKLSQNTNASATQNKKGFQNIWDHISETEDALYLHAKLISINADHLIETASLFERYSRENDAVVTEQGQKIRAIQGTGVLQNSDHITQTAGLFSSKYEVVPDYKRQQQGKNPHAAGWFEIDNYYVITEDDIGSGGEFYASENAALAGDQLDTSTLKVGDKVTRFVRTEDTAVDPNKKYYVKDLSLHLGTNVTISEDGQMVTVAEELVTHKENIDEIKGSALWTMKNHITGVVGEFDIATDPTTGEKSIIIHSGGGMRIRKDGAEYGVYSENNLTGGVIVGKITDDNSKLPFENLDSKVTDYTALGLYDNNNLTAGVLVTKLNDDTTGVKIKGDKVDIEAKQVRVGDTQNVETWMNGTDVWKNDTNETLDTYYGMIIERATIGQLNAVNARIESLDADWVKSKLAAIDNAAFNAVSVSRALVCSGRVSGSEVAAQSMTINGKNFTNCIVSASVDGNVLTLVPLSGDAITFSKAITSAVWGWSGGAPNVTLNPQDQTFTGSDPIDGVYKKGDPEWADDYKSVKQPVRIDSEAGTTVKSDDYVWISTAPAWNDGHTKGLAASATVDGDHIGQVYSVTVKSADGTTKQIAMAMGKVYTDARSGWTEGEFSPVDITLQGSAVTCYIDVSSGGTSYYRKGSSFTAYSAGDEVTVQGESETLYLRGSSKTPTKQSGNRAGTKYSFSWRWCYDSSGKNGKYLLTGSSGGTTMYQLGSAFTYYDVGEAGTWYKAGSTVTRYKAGTTKVKPATNGRTVTPVDFDHEIRLSSAVRYTAGTRYNKDKYYTKNE